MFTNRFILRRILLILIILFSIPVSVFLISQATKYFGRASGRNANLMVDIGSAIPVGGGNWKHLAQGGEERERMLAPLLNEVKKLEPRYIRIDHIYDAYNVVGRDASGNLTFNWQELDLTVNDILDTGASLFLSLSYTPPILSNGGMTDEPSNWTEWELLVQKTIEHYSGRDSLNLPSVYYEVWNEPDLFGGFKIGGEKSYLKLYSHSVNGALKAENTNFFKIGGPATTNLYKNWFDGFLKFVSENNLRLDFYSWHKYSKDMVDFEKDFIEVRTWLSEFPEYSNLEFVITETGPNSENDSVYDNNFGAIHTLATAAVLESKIDKAFLFEIKDGPGPEKFWGRWGMFTHEKFGAPEAKPRAAAVKFLNNMKGNKISVSGEGSWVKAFAKEEGGIIRTLVVSYDRFGKHYEAVPITFSNLKSQNFLFKRIDFQGDLTERLVATTSASWQTVEGFEPNTAAIFEIIPK